MHKLRRAVTAMLALCAGILAGPPAFGDPGTAELDGLAEVAAATYGTYATYGAGGWQFVTPDGVRCRIMTYMRWSGPPEAACWGTLPGVASGENYAYALARDNVPGNFEPDRDGSQALSGFKHVPDLAVMETYRSYEHRGGDVVDNVDPNSYHLLGAGSKIFEKGPHANVTCGVKAADTICVVDSTTDDHWSRGFVLSPEGSHAF
ncbi:hypothetical protein [Mycobacterium branderi]|uniref:Uncharacterized protein n=1 Tax=Mycobacterium branderi TaxID=43348 RepID=A0A7I7WDV0_9MYCO|nr:hypothetical protein [Mycobacterium branderi]MCV7236275.1 hypothetical protein [Mycobacterium branderi]ORA35450.1 hypothetical protein BST20_17825 [Mycobacterium branderi]BBZ15157.1 hypothetical protein MBRA_53520 [Mycobacterium branderi]